MLWLTAVLMTSPSITGKVALDGPAAGPVVVFVEKAPGAKPKDGPAALSMAQKDTEFAPRALVAMVGQKVEFPNQDAFYHNVFSTAPGNAFDLGLYRGGLSKSVTLKAAGEIDVYCNIHPGMAAKILVLDNDLYVTAGADGAYSLSGLPDGHYTIVAWSATHQPEKREIDVKGKAAVKSDFQLKPRKADDHLNKNGESYGRYK